jgi:IS30 family transposase
MDARDKLIQSIRESGLSISDYAQQVLARHHSTVYRWLSRQQEIPPIVQRWLDSGGLQNDND